MKRLIVLLAAVLLKSLVWMAVVPIWQAPDEQAHFAQLEYMTENKTLSVPSLDNLSKEIAVSEQILGTFRDQFGNNQYTYHPDYKNHSLIPVMPISWRTTYVGREAAGYPPLYYQLAEPFYNAVYSHNLVDRVMAARIVSVICVVILAAVAYQIGGLVLAVLVSFQPMISFVAAGVHPDNLLNLLCSLAIWMCLLILKNGLRWKYLAFLALSVFLAWETKILIVFMLPVMGAVIAYKLFRETKLAIFLATLCLIVPVGAFVWQWTIPYMPVVTVASPLAGMNFVDYMKFRGPKLLFEMWPWYWGVFKWLGVTLPPLVMKVITRIAILGVIGLGVRLVIDKNKKILIFFILASSSYLLYLVLWDWRLMQAIGFSQGLQGRYLFPNIIPQMALLLAGLTVFKRFEKQISTLLVVGMVALNMVALYTVFQSYH
ncbi:MAG: DUF2142 domain-containing protein [Patescibacteria group bacterium]|nr:DUF2142 domain-containing protein [Patescibacteria group bacterium]MCL5431684.1 DUF2142 domain-containing protein [Patescibacteria group bacterium]